MAVGTSILFRQIAGYGAVPAALALTSFTINKSNINMKSLFAAVIGTLVCVSQLHAGQMKVEAAMAKDQDSKPTNTFSADVPKVYAFFKTHGSEKGDKLRSVWIAEDVGDAAPAGTTIDEASLTADEDDFYGAFSLSRPTKGWPVGKYRVDIYAGDELVTSVKFTIKKADKAEQTEDKSVDE
jgi:hypothetical protein